MGKSAAARKAKPKLEGVTVHDIIKKLKDTHQKADKKLTDLAHMCLKQDLRIK